MTTNATMKDVAGGVAPRILVVVAKDQMTAELRVQSRDNAQVSIPAEQLTRAITAAHLPALPQDEFVRLFGGEDPVTITDTVIIANGTPPVEDIPGRLELLQHTASDPNAPVSFYDRHHYVTASPGEQIARLIPRTIGTDGTNVFGKSVPRRRPPDEPHALGTNDTVGPDGSSVTSTIAGTVRFEHGKLWVEPLLAIAGDVDFSVGNVDFSGDVQIHHNVLDLFHVRSKGSITIDGAVEAADVSAAIDLTVRGGVLGKEKGHCSAGRNMSVKYATNVTLSAGGSIHAHVEIAGCHLTCGGELNVDNGSIIGGTIRARGGIKCGTLGSPASTSTTIECGTDPLLREKVIEQLHLLQALQKQIHAMNETMALQSKNQKFLSAAQKETLTEMMFESAEAKTKASAIVKDLRAGFEAAAAAAREEIHVTQVVYAGVSIRFAGVQCTIEQAIRGPVRLIPRLTKDGLMVCAVTDEGAYLLPLPSHPVRDDIMHSAAQAMKIA